MRLLTIVVVALLAALAPELPFWMGGLIEVGAPIGPREDLALESYGFRKDLTTQYFSLAVLCISLVGFTLVKFELRELAKADRRLMMLSLAAAVASILIGIVQLEVLTTLLIGQMLVSEWPWRMQILPSIQLFALAFSALSALSALITTFGRGAAEGRARFSSGGPTR